MNIKDYEKRVQEAKTKEELEGLHHEVASVAFGAYQTGDKEYKEIREVLNKIEERLINK